MSDLPAQPNRSLIHGLECLQTVAGAGRPLGSRELARMLGLEATRVSRLLGTLAHLGLVQRTAQRKYESGPALHVLSALSLRGSGLLSVALPHLAQLQDVGMTYSLGVVWRRHVCYLVRAEPGQTPTQAVGAHTPFPVHQSILGLTLLAGREEESVRALLTSEPEPLSPEQVDEVIREVARARERGYALREREDGWASVGVAVGDPPLAALALTGERPPALVLEDLVARLRDVAAQIEADL